jgi:23S rRNA pseudouridine2605 synthase
MRIRVTDPARQPRFGLARALSKLGYCSRSQAAELIRAGRVRLNGTVRRNAESPVNLARDRITVDGNSVHANTRSYWMLNKPRGLMTTASDEKGRATIYGCLPRDLPWLAPVGRLDQASEGLLLLTNDSEWAARITDPATHLPKTYHVQINAIPSPALCHRLQQGVCSGKDALHASHVRVLRTGKKNGWLEVVLDEGRNRHIRRMLAVLDLEILRLVRVAIGSLQLGTLAKGAARPLADRERTSLDADLRAPVQQHASRASLSRS